MTDKANEIAALLAPTVASLGLELLGAEYLPSPGGALLRLYIDVPAGRASRRAALGDDRGLRGGQPRSVRAARRRGPDQRQLHAGSVLAGHRPPAVRRGAVRALRRRVGQGRRCACRRTAAAACRARSCASKATRHHRSRSTATSSPSRVDNIDKARLVPDWAALGLAPSKPSKPGAQAGRAGKKRTKKSNQQAGGRQADPRGVSEMSKELVAGRGCGRQRKGRAARSHLRGDRGRAGFGRQEALPRPGRAGARVRSTTRTAATKPSAAGKWWPTTS